MFREMRAIATLFILSLQPYVCLRAQGPVDGRNAGANDQVDGFRGIDKQVDLQKTVYPWQECDEYLSASPCKITINMGLIPGSSRMEPIPFSHTDVQVDPVAKAKKIALRTGTPGQAAIVLVNSSPFLTCTVSATPAAPTRDLSANIGILLTAVGAIGAPQIQLNQDFLGLLANGALPGIVPTTPLIALEMNYQQGDIDLPHFLNVLSKYTPAEQLDGINAAIESDNSDWADAEQTVHRDYNAFAQAVKDNWKKSFASSVEGERAAQTAINNLSSAISAVKDALDDFNGTDLSEHPALFESALKRLAEGNPKPDPNALADSQSNLITLKVNIGLLATHVKDHADKLKLVQQVKDYLDLLADKNNYPTLTVKVIPMSYFSGKTVTETVTCKDGATKEAAFDNVIFTAYYERVPHVDISTGAILSLLGGRQTGVLSGPTTPGQVAGCAGMPAGSPPCGATVDLGYTTQSRLQFMPGVFGEWRIHNFRCPWAVNGAHWHPAGYVCSIGMAGGIAINPNNGTTAAEYFEGISFGIQRFAIMLGNHNGRYQVFSGGYYAGEVFPAATAVVPRTVRNWANHPALAIAYRIPLR